MSFYCNHCEKEITEPDCTVIQDTCEFQGHDVPTGFYDEVDVCPDCGEPVRSTEPAVFILDGALEAVSF